LFLSRKGKENREREKRAKRKTGRRAYDRGDREAIGTHNVRILM